MIIGKIAIKMTCMYSEGNLDLYQDPGIFEKICLTFQIVSSLFYLMLCVDVVTAMMTVWMWIHLMLLLIWHVC